MKLSHHSYGKAAVRVLKVVRGGARHSVKELEVSVMLDGRFGASYTHDDNSAVVPTDTIKNTIQVLALKYLGQETEKFGVVVVEHFVRTYSQVAAARVALRERQWQRMMIQGAPHPHSFLEAGSGIPIAEVTSTKGKTAVVSGIDDLLLLKTTESGFEGFAKDPLTTLAETSDRIFATQLEARWTYRGKPASYGKSNARILRAIQNIFAGTYSPSVQSTLYQMGKAALSAVAEIQQITLRLPNKHYLPVNLAHFGLENRNQLFIPTDEPYGRIEGTVSRES
ncbi:MAG TPA: urate oxidase [Verrucomicrobiae bacterium]|jgi:urate oxidase|nr:urate oxidase [Verrucomicrobiae bacterium]